MSRGRRRAVIVMCAVVAGAVVWLDRGTGEGVRRQIVRRWPRNDTEKYAGRRFKVVKIVDGDTLDIDIADGEYEHTRVRLLGLDTPETGGGRGAYREGSLGPALDGALRRSRARAPGRDRTALRPLSSGSLGRLAR